MSNDRIQLITYADSLGGDLKTLKAVLAEELNGLFDGVHVLPPFPSSGDRGFAPMDYTLIEPAFGTWEDIRALAQTHSVTLDLMVNHVSRHSPMFLDYLARGDASPYADFFLTTHKVFGDTPPTEEELAALTLRRKKWYSHYTCDDGFVAELWTTFGATDPSEQIDLDVLSPKVRAYFAEMFRLFAHYGVSTVRLDAVGYVIKRRGTSCFLVEPEFSDFLRQINDCAREAGIKLLCEIHTDLAQQKQPACEGMSGYDFQLPFTVLYTLMSGDAGMLCDFLAQRPTALVSTLDCHDGVPVLPDMMGLMTAAQEKAVLEVCDRRGARYSRVMPESQVPQGYVNVHQICGTYYSLLGENDDAYVLARAIQLFVPGTVQIYYVGLLAGVNDAEEALAEADDRGLNRHNYTRAEIAAALKRPVVERLLRVIRLCRSHEAFAGSFAFERTAEGLTLSWCRGEARISLAIDLAQTKGRLRFTDEQGGMHEEML